MNQDLPPLIWAPVAGRRQSWREAGEDGAALPLVLLHGIGSNSRAWGGQFAGFAGERRVLAWNAPGYAGSAPLPMAAPVAADYGAAALEWLDHLGIGRCVIVGQSLGAIMGTALARLAPDRVAALALASPAAGYGVAPGAPLPEKVESRIRDLRDLGPAGLAEARAHRLCTGTASEEARATVHAAMAEVVPQGYEQAVRLLGGADLARDVQGLPVPVLVLWGSADVVTPPESCARIASAAARCNPRASRMEVPNGGHAFATTLPHAFNAAIRPLIDAADAADLKE
ncbi:alpha/beta fold hydrolase [Novosphingobium rosa]|uniref:alpha/beta fold hydrolase n=1 Tax=Novosphingobium rosa TaxID=76978 RepID=UPI00082BFB20|nr:alpha/beta hydrolase [Novosphingobium rosa]